MIKCRIILENNNFKCCLKLERYSSADLKNMADFCSIKRNENDENCQNALKAIQSKIRSCELKPIEHSECQLFKEKYCQAFPHVACCLYVIYINFNLRRLQVPIFSHSKF